VSSGCVDVWKHRPDGSELWNSGTRSGVLAAPLSSRCVDVSLYPESSGDTFLLLPDGRVVLAFLGYAVQSGDGALVAASLPVRKKDWLRADCSIAGKAVDKR
jgi:hypothetical protein